MSEEEIDKIAVEYAKKGIDLENVEKLCVDLIELTKPVIDLAIKNKKILEKYHFSCNSSKKGV